MMNERHSHDGETSDIDVEYNRFSDSTTPKAGNHPRSPLEFEDRTTPSPTIQFDLSISELADDNDSPVKYSDEDIDAFTMLSSVITADQIADPLSFKINCLVVFIGDMARGIFFPTMWNLVQKLGGDQVMLGYTIASFSFGRMLVLPLFGSWSTTYGYKWTLTFSTYILLLGTLLFSQVLRVNDSGFLIFSNIVMGIGSGTLGVTLAYASEVTPTRNRTAYMAWVTAVQYAGTTVTPFIGSLFVVLCPQDEGQQYFAFPSINEFTSPAIFMSFMCCVTLYWLHYHFQDRPRVRSPVGKRKSKRQLQYDEMAQAKTCFGRLTIYSACLYGCMVLNAFTKGPMSCFETLGIEFAESRFGMHRATAGSIVASMGIVGAVNLMAMKILSARFDDSVLTSGGIVFFILGIIMNTFLDKENVDMNSDWKYLLSMFFSYGIGYPICHTALIGLFSKIVGRSGRPQGTLQGWFSASGSVSRITFPILAGYIVSSRDIESLFYILTAVLSLAIVFLMFFRSSLIILSK